MGTKTDATITQVREEIASLENSLTTTRSLVNNLDKALSSVLTPGPPSGEADKTADSAVVELAEVIRGNRREAMSINERLESILERLQL